MHENIAKAVKKLLGTDTSGHGFDHVERVRRMASQFAVAEKADENIVDLAALLHDVDDYKLFGEDNAKNLTNAHRILDEAQIDAMTQQRVLDIISTMGYSKYLNGIRPLTIEGQIVSDADMCDAIGANGILRTYAYNVSKGGLFFDSTLTPQLLTASAAIYHDSKITHIVQHFFDKLLKITSILMTDSGKTEGQKRQAIMLDFLCELFREEGADKWQKYIDQQYP